MVKIAHIAVKIAHIAAKIAHIAAKVAHIAVKIVHIGKLPLCAHIAHIVGAPVGSISFQKDDTFSQGLHLLF